MLSGAFRVRSALAKCAESTARTACIGACARADSAAEDCPEGFGCCRVAAPWHVLVSVVWSQPSLTQGLPMGEPVSHAEALQGKRYIFGHPGLHQPFCFGTSVTPRVLVLSSIRLSSGGTSHRLTVIIPAHSTHAYTMPCNSSTHAMLHFMSQAVRHK